MYIQNSSSGEKNNYDQIDRAACITGNSRLIGCGRNLAPSTKHVKIMQIDSSQFFYSGVYRCGQVWLCPDCAKRIMHVRSAEISKAESEWKSRGGRVWMATLTVPHVASESLSVVLARLDKAKQKMSNLREWKRFKHEFAGNIRSLEISYGKNGWHPHFHILFFVYQDAVVEATEIESVWRKALNSIGIAGDLGNSAFVLTKGRFANYVCRFSKSGSKSAVSGQNPFELISGQNELKNKQASILFYEYSKSIKGKRRLLWSGGLRKLLKLDVELSDEKIAMSTIAEIDRKDWKIICKTGSRDFILQSAVRVGQTGVLERIALIRDWYEESLLLPPGVILPWTQDMSWAPHKMPG